jgi:hypothetical protein
MIFWLCDPRLIVIALLSVSYEQRKPLTATLLRVSVRLFWHSEKSKLILALVWHSSREYCYLSLKVSLSSFFYFTCAEGCTRGAISDKERFGLLLKVAKDVVVASLAVKSAHMLSG